MEEHGGGCEIEKGMEGHFWNPMGVGLEVPGKPSKKE